MDHPTQTVNFEQSYSACRFGSASDGRAAAIAYTLIETAGLNGGDPQAWLAEVLERIPDYMINRIEELLQWNCTPREDREADA